MSCIIIPLGKKSTAIICGAKDHKCNDKGQIIYGFDDGFTGTLFDKCKVEKINLQVCDDDKLYFLRERGINVIMESVSCSVCGKAAIDNIKNLM